MKHTIDIAIQDPVWDKIRNLKKISEKAINHTIDAVNASSDPITKPIEVSLVFMNDDAIQVLNKAYRGKDKPTNVLSFALLDAEEGPDVDIIQLGDVILAFQTIEREAQIYGCSIEDHITHLIVHGCLHLLGYDHIEDDDANVMETLEIRILEMMNIRNPYIQMIDK